MIQAQRMVISAYLLHTMNYWKLHDRMLIDMLVSDFILSHSNLLQMGSVTVRDSETVDVLVMHSLSGLSTDCVFNSFRR